jgi:hypothetical protein
MSETQKIDHDEIKAARDRAEKIVTEYSGVDFAGETVETRSMHAGDVLSSLMHWVAETEGAEGIEAMFENGRYHYGAMLDPNFWDRPVAS